MLQQYKISKYKTVNGFTRKPCINQIIAYLLIVIINLSFWLLIETKYTNQIFRLFIIPWFSVFLLLLVVFGIISSGIDPSDKIMVQYRNGNPSIINQVSQLCIFCPYCNGYVKRTSKHCKLCDRCVDHFDHHCIWINNCIGSQNYKYFITMIIMAFFFILSYIISVVVLWIQDQWHNFLIEMIVNWIILSINVIFFIFLAALIGLHIYLINNNLTTFEYVLGERTAQIHAEFELKKIEQKKSYIRANEMITIEENNRQNSQQMHKTQNIFESISVCKYSDVKKQEERSQQESFHHMISSRKKMNSLRNQLEFEEDLFNLDNLNAFYKKNKSLKALIGHTIYIKSPISDMH